MKKGSAVKNYYILPCLLLMLNLANNLISYKSGMIDDPFLRTAVVMLLVLFGGRLLTGAARRQVVRAASKEREGNLSPHR